MLRFTNQANLDLSHILAGLMSFRIGDAEDPSLTLEHAEQIFDEIADAIATIPTAAYHFPNTFAGLAAYGQYVYTYTRNRTNWYAFYNKVGEDFIVTRITNNWNILLPRL